MRARARDASLLLCVCFVFFFSLYLRVCVCVCVHRASAFARPRRVDASASRTHDASVQPFASQVRNQAENQANYDMHSNDLMRASCTVPRDPVVLYQHMMKAGLQYGPSFRLLTQVWVPEALDKEQREVKPEYEREETVQ